MPTATPESMGAVQTEVENAAHILIQAMMTPLSACGSSFGIQEPLTPLAGSTTELDKPSCRLPLLALDRNTRSQSPAILSTSSKVAIKNASSAPGALSFPDQDSFEEWAIDTLTASHPEVVIEKKRR